MAEQNDKSQEKPRIIGDEDWKSQAQAEKEKLAQEVDEAQKQAESAGAAAAGPQAAAEAGGRREIPPASFTTLVSFLATQVMMCLGGMQDRSGQAFLDLNLAKHYIDTLAVLEDKTRGNLSDEEKKLLDDVIYQTRMQYVQIAQQASQM